MRALRILLLPACADMDILLDTEKLDHYSPPESIPDSLLESVTLTSDELKLYGYSLGNVASIHLVANRITPRCLIAESPFASSTSLVQGATVLDFPARWLTDGTFDNAETIRKVRVPLMLYGTDDDFVRFRDNGKIVFENANEPKKLIAVQGATHTDVPQTMGVDNYLREVEAWINGSN